MELERTPESSKKKSPLLESVKPDIVRGEQNPGLSVSTNDRVSAYDSPFTTREGTTSIDAVSRPSNLTLATGVQKTCILMGVAFLLIGLVGFGIPAFFGTHLSPTHNFIHLISGAAALYIGTKMSNPAAIRFAFGFGSLYAVLGLTGFLFGSPGMMTMPMMAGEDPLALPIVRGSFELGLNDHILHLIIAAIFLIPAFTEMRRQDRIAAVREHRFRPR